MTELRWSPPDDNGVSELRVGIYTARVRKSLDGGRWRWLWNVRGPWCQRVHGGERFVNLGSGEQRTRRIAQRVAEAVIDVVALTRGGA